MQDFNIPFYSLDEWFLQLWSFHFITRGIITVLSLFMDLTYTSHSIAILSTQPYAVGFYLLLAIAYLTIKPAKQTREIKAARLGWIFYGWVNAIKWSVWLFLDFIFIFGIDFGTEEFIWFIFEILELSSLIVIMIIVAFYAEVLLITEYQLLRARNLYELIDIQPTGRPFPLDLLGFDSASVVEYIEGLPPDIVTQLKEEMN
jgi:hypothetical protein